MAVTKTTRYEVLRRDNNTCRYCHATDTPLVIDHVMPVALGGSDKPENLVAACRDCNIGKAASNPDAELVAQVSEQQFRWAAEMESVARAAAEQAQREFEYAAALEDAWLAWGSGPDRTPIPRPSNWEQSVRHWMAAGLPVELLIDACRIAMSADHVTPADTWRYFCGVAWSKVRALQAEVQGRI